MNEKLLQYIWQFQHFNKGELTTSGGEKLDVLFPGNINRNQGPDFTDARIQRGKTKWAGNIELHLKSSDWKRHGHEQDRHYSNVILHVVWENDKKGPDLPVLELKGRVSGLLLDKYHDWMNSTGFIPCEKSISTVKDIIWQSWKERLLTERLLRKSELILEFLALNNNHWEETCWWMLARNFGMKINADSFEAIARSIPVKLLAKHKNQIHQLEAILLGQAGLLEKKFSEQYPQMLQKEYRFLKKKYRLNPVQKPVSFLRTRPGNFPTIRLAQLAMLVSSSTHLFSKIRETVQLQDIKKLLAVTANDYWHYHYKMDEPSAFKKKQIGSAMVDNLVINFVCPMVFSYGLENGDESFKNRAIGWLTGLDSESNHIINKFRKNGVQVSTAFDSQACLELKNEYCGKKRCLECAVGNFLLKNG